MDEADRLGIPIVIEDDAVDALAPDHEEAAVGQEDGAVPRPRLEE